MTTILYASDSGISVKSELYTIIYTIYLFKIISNFVFQLGILNVLFTNYNYTFCLYVLTKLNFR